jgi:diguanylate cyclase (GGDEF)-like protein/excisionase family DNA binding protein
MTLASPVGEAGLDDALRRVVALEEEVRHGALHDPLTGLPNRTLFVDRVHHELELARRAGGRVGVLFLDLDRFKLVNDSLGHKRGDELIAEIARRLEPLVGVGNTLARLGGDEFAVLCGDLPGERGAIEVAQRLLDALAQPVVIEDRSVSACASVGIAVSNGRAHSAETLVRDAGAAMSRAKERGGGRYELFDPAMRKRMTERLQLEDDLRSALEDEQLELFYQPLVSLQERRIVGVEALVRWRHPTQGIVLPGAFISVAEESGLIVPLGRWVLGEACRQLARWTADAGIDLPYLSVNLSARQLAEPGLVEEIAELLRQTGVPPARLALELTESVLMEGSDSPTAVLQDLKDLGVQLMLDDFGTGYSSLNHVKRFPISAIKVDRSFIAGVAEEPSDRHILRAIVNMAAALDVAVIAEGVESSEQARWLRHLGIGLAQGFALGRPGPAVNVGALLRDGLPLERLASVFEPLEAGADTDAATPLPVPRGSRSASTPEPPSGATVALGEAADALGISTSSLRRWADTGRIRVVRTAGGHRRFQVSDIQRLSAQAVVSQPSSVRPVALPVEPLHGLAKLLGSAAPGLAAASARAIYDGLPGWFASDLGREQLRPWAAAVADAASTGDYESALEATRRLVTHAGFAGASLLERHAFLERYGDLVLRALQERGERHAELVGTRRLFTRMRRALLEAADAAAAG